MILRASLRPGVLVFGTLLLSSPVAAHAGDGPWLPGHGYPLPGIDELVRAVVVYEGDLIAGGEFGTAGNQETGGIARFDGTTWQPLGGRFPGYVYALAVYHGKLYAAGLFRQAVGCAARNIACWDGAQWYPLGPGLTSMDETDIAFTLTVHEDRLIVGGCFDEAGGEPAANIAAFDEETWTAIGPGVPREVVSVASYGGNLIAGGRQFLRRWDGSSWAPLIADPNYYIYALGLHDGDLIAGGTFTQIGGVTAARIARWNGTGWFPMSAGFDNSVAAILSRNGELVVGGNFAASGSEPTRHLARWTGSSWIEHAGGADDMVWALTEYAAGLAAGGSFRHAGPVLAGHVALLQGDQWSALGPAGEQGVDGFVQALATYHEELIAVGSFQFAGQVQARGKARWNGSTWLPMGGEALPGWIHALAVYEDLLIAGGSLNRAGGEPARNLACWNGTTWAPFTAGADQTVICLLDTPIGLIAGGRFREIGGVDALHIARWDGSAWHPLGAGLVQEDSYGQDLAMVRSLAWNDGLLYAAGRFVKAGGVSAFNIASWNGTSWSPVGPGIPYDPYIGISVNALAFFQGELYAGGDFYQAFGAPGDNIVRFDGSTWTEPGDGADWPIETLRSFDGELYAGGQFTMIGSIPASRIARWTGSQWYALDSGVDRTEDVRVTALESWGGDLIAAGEFRRAGGIPSWYLAHWAGSIAGADGPAGASPPLLRLPNPYHPNDPIALSAPAGSTVRIDIFDAQGRSLGALQAGPDQPTVCWDGRAESGAALSSGRYFLHVRAGAQRRVHPLVLMR